MLQDLVSVFIPNDSPHHSFFAKVLAFLAISRTSRPLSNIRFFTWICSSLKYPLPTSHVPHPNNPCWITPSSLSLYSNLNDKYSNYTIKYSFPCSTLFIKSTYNILTYYVIYFFAFIVFSYPLPLEYKL